jgi:hypothetical protein
MDQSPLARNPRRIIVRPATSSKPAPATAGTQSRAGVGFWVGIRCEKCRADGDVCRTCRCCTCDDGACEGCLYDNEVF